MNKYIFLFIFSIVAFQLMSQTKYKCIITCGNKTIEKDQYQIIGDANNIEKDNDGSFNYIKVNGEKIIIVDLWIKNVSENKIFQSAFYRDIPLDCGKNNIIKVEPPRIEKTLHITGFVKDTSNNRLSKVRVVIDKYYQLTDSVGFFELWLRENDRFTYTSKTMNLSKQEYLVKDFDFNFTNDALELDLNKDYKKELVLSKLVCKPFTLKKNIKSINKDIKLMKELVKVCYTGLNGDDDISLKKIRKKYDKHGNVKIIAPLSYYLLEGYVWLKLNNKEEAKLNFKNALKEYCNSSTVDEIILEKLDEYIQFNNDILSWLNIQIKKCSK